MHLLGKVSVTLRAQLIRTCTIFIDEKWLQVDLNLFVINSMVMVLDNTVNSFLADTTLLRTKSRFPVKATWV